MARNLLKSVSIDWEELLSAARSARANAYAPYSKFRVGAAVLGASGKIFSGCNVENSSFGLTMCAERGAIAKAIADGERRIVAATVVAGNRPCPPCGMCRQVLAEFAEPSLQILLGGRTKQIITLGELLPLAFDKSFF